jgi:hypothetical protein
LRDNIKHLSPNKHWIKNLIKQFLNGKCRSLCISFLIFSIWIRNQTPDLRLLLDLVFAVFSWNVTPANNEGRLYNYFWYILVKKFIKIFLWQFFRKNALNCVLFLKDAQSEFLSEKLIYVIILFCFVIVLNTNILFFQHFNTFGRCYTYSPPIWIKELTILTMEFTFSREMEVFVHHPGVDFINVFCKPFLYESAFL